MIAGLKPYSAMKASGVEWLGVVPEHWKLTQLGRIGKFSKGKGGTKEDEVAEGVSCVRYGDLYTRHRFFIERARAYVSQDRAVDYTTIRYGDLLFAGSGETIEEIGKSAVNLLNEPACCGGDVIIFQPSVAVNAKFLGLASDCPQAVHQKSCMGQGFTVMHIYVDNLKYLWIALPPLPEQAAIVKYLDYVDRRIRRLVRAKRKLIALLTEQKQAIIHRAVTRGLDPNVRLKPSGVEWLGDVPEHWEVVRLKEVTTPIEQGWSPQCDAQAASSAEWGVLKVGCVNRDAFDEGQNKRLPSALQPVSALEIRDGDILVSRANTRELLGLAAVAIRPRTKLMLCDKLFRFRAIDDRADSRFLVHVIRQRTSRAQIESSTNGASDSMQNIGQGVIRNLLLALPPLDEQQRLVAALRRRTSSLSAGVTQAQREIDLLNEYRTRLIADVVTGKLDVREAAAALPEVDPLAANGEPDDTLDSVVDEDLNEMEAVPEENKA